MDFFSKIKHFIWYGLGSASQALSGILILPLLTRNLSVEMFGVYSMITLCGSMASSIFYLGITSALPRFYFDSDKIDQRLKILATATLIILVGAIAQTVLGFFVSGTLSHLLFGSHDYSKILGLTFAGYAFLFLNQYILAYWRLLGLASRVFNWAIINIALNLIGIYIGITYVEKTLYVPIVVFLFAQIFQFLISVILTKELMSLRVEKSLIRALTHFGLGTVFIAMGTLTIDWFDRFIVNNFLTLKDVAIYSFAYKIGTLISIVFIVPFVNVWNPMMMEQRTSENVKDLFSKATDLYFAIGSFCTVFATLFFQDIVFLLVPKKDYSEIVNFFPVIMFGTLIYGLSNILSAGYLYNKKIYSLTKVYLFSALFNILMTFIFVKKWELYGALWSSFITYTLIPIFVYMGARKFFSFDIKLRKIGTYSAAVFAVIILRNFYFTDVTLVTTFLKIAILLLFLIIVFGVEFRFNTQNVRKLVFGNK